MLNNDQRNLTGLRWQWLIVATLYTAVLWLGYQFMQTVWFPAASAQWLAIAAATMVVQMAILWWTLPYNHPVSAPTLFPFLGYANAMTLARGLLTCLLAGFLFGPQPAGLLAWAPAVLYTLERLIDFFDGYVARVTRRETRLGGILDIEFDGLGILIAVGLAIQYGKLPFWYLILGLGRQLFVLGIWLRQRRHKPVYDMTDSDHRRVIAGFQTGFISVVLWPIWNAQITMLAGYLFAIPLIVSFGRDWLVVSGAIDAGSAEYQAVRRKAKRIVEGWLPLVARLVGAMLAFLLLWQAAFTATGWRAGLAGSGQSSFTPLIAAMTVLWVLAALLLLLGVVGRVAALVLAGLAALDILAVGLNVGNGLLLACTVVVLHLGGGRLSLWQPEEHFLHTKLGAPSEPEP